MKERLIQLLDLEQLSPSKFADIIGVQRSSISHVISGRNKPSFDFLQKTLKAFPGLNASWLMLGEGSMYEKMGRNVSGNLFDSPAASLESSEEDISTIEESHTDTEEAVAPLSAEKEKQSEAAAPVPDGDSESPLHSEAIKPALADTSRKRIVQVMIIYDDDTFRTYSPSS
jgi:transcriptional regulator with XRE-family HTH domain